MNAQTVRLMLEVSIYGFKTSDDDLPIVQESLKTLLGYELIMYDKSEYCCTNKGRTWVEGILSTPLPISTWAIPERGEE